MDRPQALVNALVAQRNDAQNTDANNRADLAVANGRIEALELRVKELEAKLAAQPAAPTE